MHRTLAMAFLFGVLTGQQMPPERWLDDLAHREHGAATLERLVAMGAPAVPILAKALELPVDTEANQRRQRHALAGLRRLGAPAAAAGASLLTLSRNAARRSDAATERQALLLMAALAPHWDDAEAAVFAERMQRNGVTRDNAYLSQGVMWLLRCGSRFDDEEVSDAEEHPLGKFALAIAVEQGRVDCLARDRGELLRLISADVATGIDQPPLEWFGWERATVSAEVLVAQGLALHARGVRTWHAGAPLLRHWESEQRLRGLQLLMLAPDWPKAVHLDLALLLRDADSRVVAMAAAAARDRLSLPGMRLAASRANGTTARLLQVTADRLLAATLKSMTPAEQELARQIWQGAAPPDQVPPALAPFWSDCMLGSLWVGDFEAAGAMLPWVRCFTAAPDVRELLLSVVLLAPRELVDQALAQFAGLPVLGPAHMQSLDTVAVSALFRLGKEERRDLVAALARQTIGDESPDADCVAALASSNPLTVLGALGQLAARERLGVDAAKNLLTCIARADLDNAVVTEGPQRGSIAVPIQGARRLRETAVMVLWLHDRAAYQKAGLQESLRNVLGAGDELEATLERLGTGGMRAEALRGLAMILRDNQLDRALWPPTVVAAAK